MDAALSLINAAACGLITLALVGAILSPRVHDGVIVKVGLISMALGFGSIALRMFDGSVAGDAVGLVRSILLVNAGIAVAILGYLFRSKKARHPLLRTTDWATLETSDEPPRP